MKKFKPAPLKGKVQNPKDKQPKAETSEQRVKRYQKENKVRVQYKIEGKASAFSCAVIQASINLKCYTPEYMFNTIGRIIFKTLEKQFSTLHQGEVIPTYMWLDFINEVSRIRHELCKPNYEPENIGSKLTDPEIKKHFEDELKNKQAAQLN